MKKIKRFLDELYPDDFDSKSYLKRWSQDVGTIIILATFDAILFIPAFILSLFVDIVEFIKIVKEKVSPKEKKIRAIVDAHITTVKSHYIENETFFLDGYTHEEQTLQDFIVRFFSWYNMEYNTVGHLSQSQICGRGRRRSLGDTYLICKHYYPNCTVHEVLTIIVSLLQDHTIGGCFCTTIRKYVFSFGNTYYRENKTEYIPLPPAGLSVSSKELTFDKIEEVYKRKKKEYIEVGW